MPVVGDTTNSLQVVARVEPDERFARDGANLRADVNITFAEALTGFEQDFQLLNGSTILLNRTGVRSWNRTIMRNICACRKVQIRTSFALLTKSKIRVCTSRTYGMRLVRRR